MSNGVKANQQQADEDQNEGDHINTIVIQCYLSINDSVVSKDTFYASQPRASQDSG